MNILLSILVIILMIAAAIGFMALLIYIFFSKKRELSCACDRPASWQICTDISDPDSDACKRINEFIDTINKLKKLFMVPFHHLKAIYLYLKIKTFKVVQDIIPLDELNNFKEQLEIPAEVVQILKELGIDITPELIKADLSLADIEITEDISAILDQIEKIPDIASNYAVKVEELIQGLNVPEFLKPYIPINLVNFIPGVSLPELEIPDLPKIPIMGFVKELNFDNIKTGIPKLPKIEIPRIPTFEFPFELSIDFSCKVEDFDDIIKDSLKTVGGYIGDFAVDSSREVISKVF